MISGDYRAIGAFEKAMRAEAEGVAKRRNPSPRGPFWDFACWLIGHARQYAAALRGQTWCDRCWRLVPAKAGA